MSEPLTRDQVRGMLREIVAEFPDDYCYLQVPCSFGAVDTMGCVYTQDGEPSCLIGHLLHRLGVVVPEVDQQTPIQELLWSDRTYPRGLFAADAVPYLSNVQRYQDAGASWQECLEIADRRVGKSGFSLSADVDPEATV